MTLEELAGLYVRLFPSILLQDFLRYAIGAGGVWLAVNVALSGRIAGWRIRPAAVPATQIWLEIAASLRTVLIFAGVGGGIALGVASGSIPVYFRIEERGWLWFAASFAILVVAHDAWFYWTHRLLHRPRFFRLLHRLHHRSNNPSPFTAYAFDTGEAVVNALYFPLALAVVPSHPLAIFLFTGHMMLRNAIGHCGYELFPARADGRPLFDWMTTVTHHDLHHADARWNLGLYFTWWDRWMGTEHPQYHALYARARGVTLRARA